MRCKKHGTDLSSIVGVCASCLRERLFALIAAQEQAESQSQTLTLDGKHRISDTHPPVPRSVSPYRCRRQSDKSAATAAWPHNNRLHIDKNHQHQSVPDQRFYSTPQVGPTTGCYNVGGDSYNKKHSFSRFSLFTKLFRSKERNGTDLDSARVSVSNSRASCGGNATSATSTASGVVRKQRCRDRGMSPVKYSDCGGEDEFFDESSGYESADSWKQTPRRTPAHLPARRGVVGGHGRSVSGLAFCLSPLVRASPNRHWNQKGMPPADGGISGDIRAPVKSHLNNSKLFCANRSRKLADFGRFNPNR